jgi:3'(2'), 5'-bisphosphate nucleotidase
MDDHAFAAAIAGEAGVLLQEVRKTGLSGRPLGDEGDRRSQQLLSARLHDERPADAVLSEEGVDDPARLDADRVWIIDPLDGTREFSEPGRTDWAVHVALWERGALTVGAVALPALELVLATPQVPSPPSPDGRRPRVVVSRSRPPEFAAAVAASLDGDLVEMGSAGAKTLAVVRGEADAYVHAGGQYEWDSAAPVAVARAAGLHASRIDGSPLVYNQRDVYLPDLVVCHPALADQILKAIASHSVG